MKKNLLFILSAIICCGMALNACSSSEKDYSSVEYLAVQIDNNSYWSIINKEGEFIVKDEYDKESKISAIVDGVYWVQNNKGESQLYSVDNPKKPINDNVYKNVTVFVDVLQFSHASIKSAIFGTNFDVLIMLLTASIIVW